jgi:hypothetical protein
VKVIGPDGARLIFFFQPEEIRPVTGTYAPEIVRMLKHRYAFEVAPDLQKAGGDLSTLTFKIGMMRSHDPPFAIHELTALQTAIVVDCLTTDQCEIFLEDALSWGQETVGWRRPVTTRFRYFSAVVIELEADELSFLGKLQSICDIFAAAFENEYKAQIPQFSIRNLTFSPDPLLTPAVVGQTDVSIQRRADVPFENNRFFCTGPFRTERLIDALQKAERVLTGN